MAAKVGVVGIVTVESFVDMFGKVGNNVVRGGISVVVSGIKFGDIACVNFGFLFNSFQIGFRSPENALLSRFLIFWLKVFLNYV